MRLLLTVAQAAEAVSMSEGWIHKAIREKELPVARFGRAVRIRIADLEAYIAGKIVGTSQSDGVSPSHPTQLQVVEKQVRAGR